MRKRIAAFTGLAILLFLMLCGFAPVRQLNTGTYVYDEAGLLSEGEINSLNTTLAGLREEIGADLLVFFTKDESVTDATIRTVSEKLCELWASGGGGYGEGHEVISLVVGMADRSYFINEYNGTNAFLLDYDDIDTVEEAVVPYLSAGQYSNAVQSFAYAVQKQTAPGFFSRWYSWVMTGLLGGGAAMGIARGSHNNNTGVSIGYYRKKNPEPKFSNDAFIGRTQAVYKVNTDRPPQQMQQDHQSLHTGSGSEHHQGGGGHF